MVQQGDFGEGAVAVVAEEVVGAVASVADEDVVPAIAVEVVHGGAVAALCRRKAGVGGGVTELELLCEEGAVSSE